MRHKKHQSLIRNILHSKVGKLRPVSNCSLLCNALHKFLSQKEREYKNGVKFAHFVAPTCIAKATTHEAKVRFTGVRSVFLACS